MDIIYIYIYPVSIAPQLGGEGNGWVRNLWMISMVGSAGAGGLN